MTLCSPEKRRLVEEIGLHFERAHHLAPLAARIYAIMVLSPNEGNTFEEILRITDASKSSVSTHLNLLLKLQRVEYFTLSGDRKRYFRVKKDYLRLNLEEDLKKTKEDIKLVEKIVAFNSTYNVEKHKKHKSISILFKDYLKLQEKNLESTIHKMLNVKLD
tara:strand:+ start:250 stop:732 length:483 start_codon:yes stop_codon:yes gene_type:complete